jgi:hypothetical protein
VEQGKERFVSIFSTKQVEDEKKTMDNENRGACLRNPFFS